MTAAVVRLWLKVMDATALTARETLQHALGYGDRVRDVHRSEVWAFRWDASRGLEGTLDRVVHETNLLQNPNKHRVEVALGTGRLRPRGNVWVLVATPGAGADLAGTLARHRLVVGEVPRTARGTLWELDLAAGGEELRRLVGELATVRSHRSGLLANPHVEDVAVFEEPPAAEALARRFSWAEQVRAS